MMLVWLIGAVVVSRASYSYGKAAYIKELMDSKEIIEPTCDCLTGCDICQTAEDEQNETEAREEVEMGKLYERWCKTCAVNDQLMGCPLHYRVHPDILNAREKCSHYRPKNSAQAVAESNKEAANTTIENANHAIAADKVKKALAKRGGEANG
jgi:hypothetical protein